MTIAERLRRAVERAGVTQREIARRSGLDEATVSDLLSGTTRHPQFETVEKVVNALGVTFSSVFDEPRIQLSGADSKLASDFHAFLGRLLANDAAQKEIAEWRVDRRHLSIVRDATEPRPSEVENLPNERIPESYIRLGARRAFRVRTDSMIGIGILEGSVVYVRTTGDTGAADGMVVICRLNEALYIKRLDLRGNRKSLHSENPRYDDLLVDPEKDRFELVGTVCL